MNARPQTVRLRAYAKLNLTLEVLGRRPDGYHELRTVLQTVALADDLTVTADVPADRFVQRAGAGAADDLPPVSGNLVLAARDAYRAALPEAAARPPVAIELVKHVPQGAGLGGGSADGAAVLRALDRLNPRPLGPDALEAIAARFGSDTPFFVRGGTQLAEGRGDRLTPLPDLAEAWFVLLPLAAGVERKTARLFSLLRPDHFGDGSRSEALLSALRHGRPPEPSLLCNTFEQIEGEAFPELAPARRALTRVCGDVLLSGAGPSLFALAPDAATAQRWAATIDAALHPMVVRGVTSAEATAVETGAPSA